MTFVLLVQKHPHYLCTILLQQTFQRTQTIFKPKHPQFEKVTKQQPISCKEPCVDYTKQEEEKMHYLNIWIRQQACIYLHVTVHLYYHFIVKKKVADNCHQYHHQDGVIPTSIPNLLKALAFKSQEFFNTKYVKFKCSSCDLSQ